MNKVHLVHHMKKTDPTILNIVSFYTDGSSRPDRSGWGWYCPELHVCNSEEVDVGTNNQCELMALIDCLEFILQLVDDIKKYKIFIYTDSEYTRNSYVSWIDSWKKNGWKKSDGKPVLNVDLMKNIYRLRQDIKKHKINIVVNHVSSHKGIETIEQYYNDIADKLANGFYRLVPNDGKSKI